MSKIRKSCKDIWNAFMVKGANFTTNNNDIPFCPTTSKRLPTELVTWKRALTIYNKHIQKGDYSFKYNAFICWYIDDYTFDGKGGIWYNYKHVLNVASHFEGVITPDFSTYQDFPEPIKIYNTYRMRAYGYWLGKNGIEVINNVRWGTEETFKYSFDGLPENDILSIGVVGGGPRKLVDRNRFENGLKELVNRIKPKVIIVCGSSNYKCFEELKEMGIIIKSYKCETAKAFERRKKHEQKL